MEIRGVERLSFRERQVVALKETGHTNHDIAQRLDVSLATVATLYRRAKTKGYEVVLVLSGDPLNLYPGGADVDDDPDGDNDPEAGNSSPGDGDAAPPPQGGRDPSHNKKDRQRRR